MFSRMVRVSRSTVYNWIRGMRSHPRNAKLLERKTKGEVTLKDMGHDTN